MKNEGASSISLVELLCFFAQTTTTTRTAWTLHNIDDVAVGEGSSLSHATQKTRDVQEATRLQFGMEPGLELRLYKSSTSLGDQ